MTRTILEFLKPTISKIIFIVEWAAYILFTVLGGQKPLQQMVVGLWPLALLYGLGCVLVKWSQHATRVANGIGIALLSMMLIVFDQTSKSMIDFFLPLNTTHQLLGNMLHLTNVHHAGGSLIAPMWMESILMVIAIPVLPLSIVVYLYYTQSIRRSLWADLAFLGIFAGYGSWLIDMFLRRYVLDFMSIPNIVAFDFKDIFLLVGGVSFIIEIIENPKTSWRWAGWQKEKDGLINSVRGLSRFCIQKFHKQPFKQTLANPADAREEEQNDKS